MKMISYRPGMEYAERRFGGEAAERESLRAWVSGSVTIPSGRWQGPFIHRVPAADEVMQALDDPGVRTVAVRACVQTMKTTIAVNWILNCARTRPANILVYQPTQDLVGDFLRERVDPLAREVPGLAWSGLGNVRHFPGGSVRVLSGQSRVAGAARTARFVVVDEWRLFDKDVLGAIIGRQSVWEGAGAKTLIVSSAGLHGQCRITDLWEAGTRQWWQAPCPACGALQKLEWKQVSWDDRNPETARYRCRECHHPMTPGELAEAQADGCYSEGRDDGRPGLASFHLGALGSPIIPLPELVEGYLAGVSHREKSGSEERLQDFAQDRMAEPYDSRGAALDAADLDGSLRVRYPAKGKHAPAWVSVVTMAVDVQDDRLEYELAGWGVEEVESKEDATHLRQLGGARFKAQPVMWDRRFWRYRRAGLRHGVIPGDPGGGEVWERLDKVRTDTAIPLGEEGAPRIRPLVCMIDSGGHHAEAVKIFVRSRVAEQAAGKQRGGYTYALKGASKAGGPIAMVSTNRATAVDYGAPLIIVGSDGAKEMIYSWLRQSRFSKPERQIWTLPEDREETGYSLDHVRGLVSERKVWEVNGAGQPRIRWIVDPGLRNEPLDLAVYGLAAIYQISVPGVLGEAKKIRRAIVRAEVKAARGEGGPA